MDKKPSATLGRLREIERTHPTPLYLCDERGIRENIARLRQAFSWNRECKEYFTVEATSNPFLLDILKDMRCDTDCSFMTEPMVPRACGFSGPDIMFPSNDTPPEEPAYAERLGAIINLDDIIHTQCLKGTLGRIPGTINCRFNPGGLSEIGNSIMDNLGNSKYSMAAGQIGQVFKILKEKNAKRFGIHALLASDTMANEYYPMLVKTLLGLAVELKEETGIRIAFINLSGGIEIFYRPDQGPNGILAIGNDVRGVYEEILVPAGMDDVALRTELGRFVVRPHGALMAKTVHEEHIYKEYVGVDACAMNPMRLAMYGAYHRVTVMSREDEPYTRMYDVVGSLCENNDKFAVDRMFPEIKKGDPLLIHGAEAHGLAMGYNYNGRLKSVELLLKEDGAVGMIRRAETPKDYFATFNLRDILRNVG